MLEQTLVAIVLIAVVIMAGVTLYRQLTGKGGKCGCCSGKCSKINDYLEVTKNSQAMKIEDEKAERADVRDGGQSGDRES